MALIVEDGTVVAGAESYLSVADADTYHTSRGMNIWLNLSTLEKEQALRRATDHMVSQYRTRWKGARVKFTQPLDWPRQGVTPDDFKNMPGVYYGGFIPYNTIPQDIKNACAELALRGAAAALTPDDQQKVLDETVGPIKIRYDGNSPTSPRFTQVDNMLRPYLTAGPGQLNLVRT